MCFRISDSVLVHYLLIDDLIDTLIQIWEDKPHDTICQHIRTSTLGTAYKDDYDTHMHNACKDFQIVYVVHQSDLQLKYEQNT